MAAIVSPVADQTVGKPISVVGVNRVTSMTSPQEEIVRPVRLLRRGPGIAGIQPVQLARRGGHDGRVSRTLAGPTAQIEIVFGYDADGLLTSEQADGVARTYLVDAERRFSQVVEERVGGSVVARPVWGASDDLLARITTSGGSFALQDGQRNVRALADHDRQAAPGQIQVRGEPLQMMISTPSGSTTFMVGLLEVRRLHAGHWSAQRRRSVRIDA